MQEIGYCFICTKTRFVSMSEGCNQDTLAVTTYKGTALCAYHARMLDLEERINATPNQKPG